MRGSHDAAERDKLTFADRRPGRHDAHRPAVLHPTGSTAGMGVDGTRLQGLPRQTASRLTIQPAGSSNWHDGLADTVLSLKEIYSVTIALRISDLIREPRIMSVCVRQGRGGTSGGGECA